MAENWGSKKAAKNIKTFTFIQKTRVPEVQKIMDFKHSRIFIICKKCRRRDLNPHVVAHNRF